MPPTRRCGVAFDQRVSKLLPTQIYSNAEMLRGDYVNVTLSDFDLFTARL